MKPRLTTSTYLFNRMRHLSVYLFGSVTARLPFALLNVSRGRDTKQYERSSTMLLSKDQCFRLPVSKSAGPGFNEPTGMGALRLYV